MLLIQFFHIHRKTVAELFVRIRIKKTAFLLAAFLIL